MNQTGPQAKQTAWASDIQTEYEILAEYGELERVSHELMRLKPENELPTARQLLNGVSDFRRMLDKQRQVRLAVITKLRIMSYEARHATQADQLVGRRRKKL